MYASVRRVEVVDGTPIAVIRRFDCTADGARPLYLSAGSLLQAQRHQDRAYSEVADALRAIGAEQTQDVQQLSRRILFNLVITNTDDHLWNLGVLHVGQGQWRLAPTFDLNPFPERIRESRTWLSEDTGPINSLEMLVEHSEYFALARLRADVRSFPSSAASLMSRTTQTDDLRVTCFTHRMVSNGSVSDDFQLVR